MTTESKPRLCAEARAHYWEQLFCASYLAVEMFPDSYYEMLSIIGDDYE